MLYETTPFCKANVQVSAWGHVSLVFICMQDVTLYMNPCPYTISNQAPLPQVFTLFRTMGLHHLPVVKASGVVSL